MLLLTTVWFKKYLWFYALALITALRAMSLKYSLLLSCWRMPTWRRFVLKQCILYFQVIDKNRHLWPSLTDENDSLLSWLRRSPIYVVCKCLFFRQSMCKVTNVTNLSRDNNASVLVAIWWNFCYDIPLRKCAYIRPICKPGDKKKISIFPYFSLFFFSPT